MTQESAAADVMVTAETRLIHVPTQAYPVTLATVKLPVLVSFGKEVPLSYLKEQGGYDIVHLVTAPTGDVVTETQPAMDSEGRWTQQYHVREFDANELKDRLDAAKVVADSVRLNEQNEILAKGAEFDFGGEHGVQHVQMRSMDRVNVSGLAIKVLRNPEHTDVFCTFENKVIPVDAAAITALSDRVLAAYTRVMAESWTLRELIESATKVSDIPTAADIKAIFTDAVKLS